VLELDFALELWDGSRVPANAPADAMRIAIADEAALPSLIRRPSFSTLIDLYVRGAIDIRGGTLFEFAARRPNLRGSEIRRRVDKGLLIRTLLPFAFTSSASSRPAFDDELDGGAGATRDDAAAARRRSSSTTTSRTTSTGSSSTRRWSTAAATSPTGATTSPRRNATSST
jgi:cyclopropane-fatty-acyl-phospholipid synthase